jgi:NTP pyrophosphatase (non-canonical NTP hydrolase)
MNDEICFLIRLLRDGVLLKLVIKLRNSQISDDLIEFPMEPDSRKELWNYLPPYLQDGEIVEVSEIYETFDARPLPIESKEEAPREETTLVILQREHREWSDRNFGHQPRYHSLLGVVEELGELAHAHLKAEQGIRAGAELYKVKAKDAIGDIVIFLAGYCSANGFDLEDAVRETWEDAKERAWKANPDNGAVGKVEEISPMSYKEYCEAQQGVLEPEEMHFSYITNYLAGFVSFEKALLPAREGE